MWSLLSSAVNYLLRGLLSGGVVKFVVFTAIYLLLGVLGSMALALLGILDFTGIGTLFGDLPDGLLFFLGVFRLDVGIPMILAAMAARFAIRRLPVIG